MNSGMANPITGRNADAMRSRVPRLSPPLEASQRRGEMFDILFTFTNLNKGREMTFRFIG
jgi:hypothetical protein